MMHTVWGARQLECRDLQHKSFFLITFFLRDISSPSWSPFLELYGFFFHIQGVHDSFIVFTFLKWGVVLGSWNFACSPYSLLLMAKNAASDIWIHTSSNILCLFIISWINDVLWQIVAITSFCSEQGFDKKYTFVIFAVDSDWYNGKYLDTIIGYLCVIILWLIPCFAWKKIINK